MSVTEAQIIAAIREAQASKSTRGDGLTTAEIAEAMGVSVKTALGRLRPVVQSGVLQAVRIPSTTIDGRPTVVPGWRVAA